VTGGWLEPAATSAVRAKARSVRERAERIDAMLPREDVVVERVPMGTVVAAPRARQEDDTLVIPLIEAVIMVARRLVLREEVCVRPRRANRCRLAGMTRQHQQRLAVATTTIPEGRRR